MRGGGNTGKRGTREEREAGLRWAREWRIRNKAYLDALYPEDVAAFCPECGRRR